MTQGEPILRDHTVLVENGRITALGPTVSVQVPSHAVRIDGRGKYLMPGLADMHSHLEHFNEPAYLKLFLVHGVTTVRSMDGHPKILGWKRQAAARRLVSPDIHTAGPILDGSPPVRDDNVALATPEEARRAVEGQAKAGYDFIKVYANLSQPTFNAIVAAAAGSNLAVAGHVPRSVPLGAFLTSGVRSLEHIGDLAEPMVGPPAPDVTSPAILKRRLGFPVDQKRMGALVARIAASGIWVVPTLITDERIVTAPVKLQHWEEAPELAAVDHGLLEYWRGSLQRNVGRLRPADWQWLDKGKANRYALVRALYRAGVPLLLGTDTPQPFVFPGSSVHDELASYVAAGLSPGQALTLATREPARFLGQDHLWGTIAHGKRADLLLVDANPLADIAATRRIAGVVRAGRWMPPQELARMRQEVEAVAANSGSASSPESGPPRP